MAVLTEIGPDTTPQEREDPRAWNRLSSYEKLIRKAEYAESQAGKEAAGTAVGAYSQTKGLFKRKTT